MVLDQGAWLKIQKDEEANLALSPEEAELLESVRKAGVGDRLGYPLFINGRAGSGKSTMLQYLAADYVEFSLERSDGLKPIYMTYSRDLLERAKQTVRGLLTTHHKRLLEGAPDSSKIDALLSDSFVVFHEFLYSLLTPEDAERFASERRVTYAEFRRLWAEEFGRRPEAKHMSPDLAWHTIRSYIKGRRSTSDDDLDPEEFDALPPRQRSVSLDTYRQIYEHVWCRWYKRLCEEQGYWDDQDLAARVLESSSSGAAQLPSFGAVFCDEAQDFTPLELDIIFQLSLFSRRSLSPQDLQRVPIAFAGDPLQTINPTGFRWEAVKADFHERFRAVLDPRRRANNVKINYHELQFNYRSNSGIVRFCNLIQLIRAACLGDRDVRPQKVWWVDDLTQPVWFSVEDANTQQRLLQQPGLVKLVNCEEGEESDYAGKDSILKMLDQKDDVFRNVLGPMRAKGLEFPAVVLYRFAETAPDGFLDLLTGKSDVSEEPERQLPFQCFLNRLYVAASRAKRQLFVVDQGKEFDNEGFWKFATDFNVVKNLVQRTAKPEDWSENHNHNHFIPLVKGLEGAWTGQRIDPGEQGKEYAAQGRRNRDPYLMRQAALAFESAGNKIEAERCKAGAEEFEGKLREAGDRYRESDFFEEAFKCYWQGQVFDRICDLKKSRPEYASRLKSRAADFAVRGNDVPAARLLLEEISKAAEDREWRYEASKDTTWRVVLAKLVECLAKAIKDHTQPWQQVYATLRQLMDKRLSLPEQHVAPIAYAAGEYADAVEIWERVRETDREEYRKAKARSTPFPENVVWFGRAKEYAEVLKKWQAHRSEIRDLSRLKNDVVGAVADAAFDVNDLDLVRELLTAKPEKHRVLKLAGLEPFPENVVWFGRAGEYGEVVKQWQAHRSEIRDLSSLKSDVVGAVADAAFDVNDLGLVCELLTAKPDRRRVQRLLEKAQQKEDNRALIKDAACVAVRFFVRSRSWEEVVSAAEGADFNQLLKDRAEAVKNLLGAEGAAAVLRAAVEALARSEELVNESSGRQQVIAEFLNRTFIASGASPDRHGLRPEVVGAAIERAGKIVDALRYYENLERDSGTSEGIRRFAAERLVRNLERYAEYLSRQGDEKQVQERAERAKKIRQHYQLGSRPIPDYPILEEAGRNAGGPSEWMRGPFKLTLSRSHARLRIEHTERFETVTVYAPEKKLRGDADFEARDSTEGHAFTWQIPNWATTVQLADVADGYTVSILYPGDRFEVRLPKPGQDM